MSRNLSDKTKQYIVGALALTLSVVGADVSEERLHRDIKLNDIKVSEYTYQNDFKPQYSEAMSIALTNNKSLCDGLKQVNSGKDKCENPEALKLWEDIANKEVKDKGCKVQLGNRILDGVLISDKNNKVKVVESFNNVIKNGC